MNAKHPNAAKKINSLAELHDARSRHKCVFCPWHPVYSVPKPAAFIINMTGGELNRLISTGMWVYIPNKAKGFKS